MSAATATGRTLDRRLGRNWSTWSGIPAAVTVPKDGVPRDAKGNPIPAARQRTFHLQDGMFFTEGGLEIPESELARQVPKEARDWRQQQIENNPVPGVTHPGRVLECGVRECPFVSCSEVAMREHLRGHDLSNADRREMEARVTGSRSRFSVGDFADPTRLLANRPPRSGPGASTPGPDEE